MNEQDREDVLLITEAVLENYLAEPLVKDLINDIRQSIKDNWYIVKLIHARQRGDSEEMIKDVMDKTR